MKIRSNQSGVGAIEALLILVIIVLLGGTGWYVWHSKKQTDKTLNTANKTVENTALTKSKPVADATATWKTFTSKDGWSMKIPDGWKLYTDNSALLSMDAFDSGPGDVNLGYKAGTPAEITYTQGGRDGLFRFITVYNPGADLTSGSQKIGDFAAKNVTGLKYYKLEGAPDGPGDPEGSKLYWYVFKQSGKTVYIKYVIAPGDTNRLELVEKAIKTFNI